MTNLPKKDGYFIKRFINTKTSHESFGVFRVENTHYWFIDCSGIYKNAKLYFQSAKSRRSKGTPLILEKQFFWFPEFLGTKYMWTK